MDITTLAVLLLALPGQSGTASQMPMTFLHHPDSVTGGRFGAATAVLDLDRNGQPDLVVGSPGGHKGRVFVYLGPIPPDSTELVPSLELVSPQPKNGDAFGTAFAVGDLDGDSREELVIGAPGWKHGSAPQTGAGFLYDPDDVAPWTTLKSTDLRTARLGFSVAVGHFGGGSEVQVALGAPGYNGVAGLQAGAVHVFSNLAAPQPTELLLRNPDPSFCGHDQQFGHRVAAGDWDGDGRRDLAVSAIFNDVLDTSPSRLVWPGAGQIFVYPSPVQTQPRVTINNPDPGSDPFPDPGVPCAYQRFGNQIRFGDLTGDGLEELAVGAARKDAVDVCDAGRVFLFSGLEGLQFPKPVLALDPPVPVQNGVFGYNLAFADVVGDGRLDWVVGNLNQRLPAIHVWTGPLSSATWDIGAPTQTFPPPGNFGSHYIESLSAGRLGPPGGDHERDELILGDPSYDIGLGRVVIIYW